VCLDVHLVEAVYECLLQVFFVFDQVNDYFFTAVDFRIVHGAYFFGFGASFGGEPDKSMR